MATRTHSFDEVGVEKSTRELMPNGAPMTADRIRSWLRAGQAKNAQLLAFVRYLLKENAVLRRFIEATFGREL